MKIVFLTVLDTEIPNQSIGVSGFFHHVFCSPSLCVTHVFFLRVHICILVLISVLQRNTTNEGWAHAIIQSEKEVS